MYSALRRFSCALLTVAVLTCGGTTPGMTVSLTKTLVKNLKDKVTVTTNLKVDKHHLHPNAIDADGDIHMAGRDSVVQLPLVAEIINGRNEKDTLQFLLGLSPGQPVDVTGVWRFWFEHPSAGESLQTQGDPVAVPGDANPKHIFEIHPITKFGSFTCLDSFLPIVDDQLHPTEEYEGTPATKAFPSYDQNEVTIGRSDDRITINSKRAVFNYTKFFIRLAGKPKDVGDGFMVFAEISATKKFEEPLLVKGNRRMVFAKDSKPANTLKGLVKGDKLHVMGIPRVNLHDVFDRASVIGNHEESTGPLPYEMIIVAILK